MIDAPKVAHSRIYAKREALEAQESDISVDLAKLHTAQGIRYTEEDATAWMKQICKGDLFDEDFKRHIIDVFTISICFYDNRIVIFYNIRGRKQISYLDAAEAVEGEKNRAGTSECSSDLIAPAPLKMPVTDAAYA